ncbi:TPA_asm: L [Leucadendron betacytorhabdovirus 1]|nr:TPA_asm: L [Leucadendron betacytorhabdovirus 1]
MADFLDFDELLKTAPARGLGDYHLRSALQLVNVEGLLSGRGRERELKAFRGITRKYGSQRLIAGEPIDLFLSFLEARKFNRCRNQRLVDELISLLEPEFEGLNAYRFQNDKFQQSLEYLKRGEWRETTYGEVKRALVRLILVCMSQTSNRSLPDVPGLNCHTSPPTFSYEGISIDLFGELFTIEDQHRNIVIYNMDHLRMSCDKITERDNIMAATMIGHRLFPSIYPTTKIITEVFALYDGFLSVYHNDGYSAIKVFEALITGYLLSSSTSHFWDSKKFLDNTIRDLSERDRVVSRQLIDILRQHNLTCHHVMQICGLFRSWGHPAINVVSGMQKVHQIATAQKHVDQWTAKAAGWKFMEVFMINYFNKERQYPPFFLKPGAPRSYLQDCLLDNLSINRKHPEYSLPDWDQIILGQNFSVPTSFNLSMIVSDTAISPTREELKMSAEAGSSGLDPVQRRGVLKWMRDGVLECIPLLESINNNPRGLDKNNLLIGLYPKEREQNVKPRMFALMPLIMRSAMVVTESMLADHIIPYIPGVTMTYSMLQLQKEMIKLTMRQRELGGQAVTFCISLDFEKWNLNMRRESTYYVFQQLGNLFGLPNIYNRTYDLFYHSIIYLADGSYILQLDHNLDLVEPDSSKAYQGHMGGFEGLRQKGWTIFTVCLISEICDRLGVDWRLMGQGDNQVLMVTIHSRFAREHTLHSPLAANEVRGKLETLLSELESSFGLVGLPLKPLETWVSDSFFSYGKIPIYRGVPCSMSLKRISRVFFFSNEDLMTLDNALGSISTNAQASAMNDPIPIVPYIMARWQHLQCIKLFMQYHPLCGNQPICPTDYPKFSMYDKDNQVNVWYESHLRCTARTERLLMALIPKTLGGFNILTFFEMVARGFSDPPNRDFQFLKLVSEHCNEPELKVGLTNCMSLHLNDKIMYSYLVSDPTGLNLFVPTNSSTAIKQMIHKTIEDMSFDSPFSGWFKELLTLSDPSSVDELVSQISQPDVLNVRFLHDIIGSTLHGYSDAIASKVDKTVTLSRMALSSEDVVGKLVKNEIRFINYFLWRVVAQGNFPYRGECPSLYIRRARSVGWRKQIIGVDVPFPHHFISVSEDYTDRPDSYVEILISDEALTSEFLISESVGGSLPYLGSVTQEKVISSPVRAAYGTEPLITRPLRMLRCIGWFVDADSNFAELLRNLVQAVCNLDPNVLVYLPDDVKGSMSHRYSDFSTKHGSLYLPLYGPATFLNLSTNHFLEFSKGSKNVTLHFQALLCYLQMSAVCSLYSSNQKRSLRYWRGCSDCITEIVDDFPDLDNPINPELIPSKEDNPYLYLTEDQIPLEIRSRASDVRALTKIALSAIPERVLYQGLTTWLVFRMLGSLYSASSDTENIFDVSSLERTIYLKIRPLDFLRVFRSLLWIRIASEAKYTREKYPTWNNVKTDIVRTLARVPPSGFIVFSGYYLWEDSVVHLKELQASFPNTYPMTAQSIAVSAKNTCIKFLKRPLNSPLRFPSSNIIFSGMERDFSQLAKTLMITESDGTIKECPWCVIGSLRVKVITMKNLTDIFQLRCKAKHNLLSFQRFLDIKYLSNAPVSAAIEKIPQYSRPLPRMIETPIDLRQLENVTRVCLSNRDLVRWVPTPGVFPILPWIPTGINWIKEDLPFRLPTDSLYSCASILTVLRPSISSIITLGDGFGYSSLAVSYRFPRCSVWSWTLIDISTSIAHSARLSRPPTHFYLPCKNIDTSLSFEQPSDISGPLWVNSLITAIKKTKAQVVFSDAELWYTDVALYPKLIQSLYDARVHTSLIKVNFQSMQDLFTLLMESAKRFEHWKLIETASELIQTGSGWLYLQHPFSEITERYFDRPTKERIYDNVVSSITDVDSEWIERGETQLTTITDLLSRNERFLSYQEELVGNWFCHIGLDGWLEDTFTVLFNRLRTGRRPKKIADLTGSDLYYLRDSDIDEIKIRLIFLAASLMTQATERRRLVTAGWKVKWQQRSKPVNKKTRGQEEKREKIGWELFLSSSDRCLNGKEVSQVLRYATTARRLRLEKYSGQHHAKISFDYFGETIKFLYIPRHKQEELTQCTFLITKIAAKR